MKKIIFIKYGELNTKKGNIKIFINALYKNINHKLKDCNVSINKTIARTYIELNEDNEQIVIERLKEIFGIQAIVLAYRISTDIQIIKDKSLEVMKTKKVKTFKVATKRSYKQFKYNSMEVNDIIGSHILSNIDDLRVDVHNPEYVLNIEIRYDYSYLYIEEIKGLGGYPFGIQGKGVLMLSGGIDSPVAGFLSLKRGVEIECIYFDSPPHTSIEALNKVIKLCRILSKYSISLNLHVVPFTTLQEEIYKNVDPTYMITIMRRMMYRIGEQFAKQNKAHILINGESIGQVASQTLTSMQVINSVTNMPVIRPVVCFDKLEIIDIAKKIGTYETSILPFEDCCTIFVPQHPVINPSVEKCFAEEKKFDYETLIKSCISNIKTIKIEDTNKFSDLL
ncbi:MAG: tRNA 4-thiouridine(8) synthase ThiI [Bacilli bacterium]|nr:tRNA 4-thiouridine(8) synthase ThiI [Bacilli bacterium]MDD4053426.1 tRNA 4-thiouridine(8) synthase ThiI [Bacilli bacterium]MDD4410927.1 tRNA 4-thiouridine(8) synthase ThiI [Bacilli bacterium]